MRTVDCGVGVGEWDDCYTCTVSVGETVRVDNGLRKGSTLHAVGTAEVLPEVFDQFLAHKLQNSANFSANGKSSWPKGRDLGN